MIRNVLEHIGGVGIYGIISISLFFAFFIGMLIWALCLKKSYLNSMRELPLDGGEIAPEHRDENQLKSNLP
jgi:cytochrome c oxidase cbb3-type subunit IV